MALQLDVQLLRREPDRVEVEVTLAPRSSALPLGGLTLQLLCPQRSALGPRMQLPVSGLLQGALSTRIELRALTPIPEGSSVLATAWWEEGQLEATCSADRYTDLQDHLAGPRARLPGVDDVHLEVVGASGRLALLGRFPWLTRAEPPEVLDDDGPTTCEDIADDLGLDEDCAAWLKTLLDED